MHRHRLSLPKGAKLELTYRLTTQQQKRVGQQKQGAGLPIGIRQHWKRSTYHRPKKTLRTK